MAPLISRSTLQTVAREAIILGATAAIAISIHGKDHLHVLQPAPEGEAAAVPAAEGEAAAVPPVPAPEGEAATVPAAEAAAAAAAPGGPTAQYNADVMPKIPTTVSCVISLANQYFVVYLFLAVFRTINQLKGACGGWCRLLESAAQTVNYCPMLSVLFLAARMRADQLTQGRGDEFNLPSGTTQTAMQMATWAILGQLIVVLQMPLWTGELSVPVDAEGNVDSSQVEKNMNKWAAMFFNGLRYLLLATLYGGAITVVYGIYTMVAPESVFPNGTPAVSPAVGATINLASQFFLVYLALALVRTWVTFKGTGPQVNKLGGALQLAAFTLNLAPMLAILFIGARMRALTVDPVNGSPQPWAQNCFWLCAGSICVQTLLVLLLPYTSPDIKCVRGDFQGDIKFVGASGWMAHVAVAIRYLALLALYGGFTAVAVSIITIEGKDGAEAPPVSPTLLCVLLLCFQYFGVYLVLFVAQTLKSFIQSQPALGQNAAGQKTASFLTTLGSMAENARATVMFAPMLSCLFIGTRLRSMQLSRTTEGFVPKGAGPQTWVQDCMYLASWAVLFQVIMVIALSALYGNVEMDQDGNPVVAAGSAQPSPTMTGVLTFFRYASMIAMYGGAGGVVFGLETMTPEKIQPYSSAPLIPGVEVPAPGGAATEFMRKMLGGKKLFM